jgi:AraC family transcriptional regulator
MFNLNEVHIEQRATLNVLALKHLGDYQTIGVTFERLMNWAAGKALLTQPIRSLAIYYDDPISKQKEALVSDACIALPEVKSLTNLAQGDVKVLEIPGTRCATYLFKGSYSELDKPYRWLYDTWLAQSGEEVGQNPPYEEYLNDARTTAPAELLTLICIPLNG